VHSRCGLWLCSCSSIFVWVEPIPPIAPIICERMAGRQGCLASMPPSRQTGANFAHVTHSATCVCWCWHEFGWVYGCFLSGYPTDEADLSMIDKCAISEASKGTCTFGIVAETGEGDA